MSGDINVLALVKGKDRYIVLFDDDTQSEALRTLGKYASNPELSFSWYDAAVLSQKIRTMASSKPRQSWSGVDADADGDSQDYHQSPAETPFNLPALEDWLNDPDCPSGQ